MVPEQLLSIPLVKHYLTKQDIINILLEHKNKDGVCIIYQREIAKKLGISQSFISLMLRKLESFDKAIEIIGVGKYDVIVENLFESELCIKLLSAYYLIVTKPDLIKPPHVLKDTAKLLDITVPQLQFISGFVYL